MPPSQGGDREFESRHPLHKYNILDTGYKMKIKTNPIEDIDKVLETAKLVFKPTTEEILKYHKKEVWLNKINSGGLLLAIYDDNIITAFAICDKRENTLHIWNVGVLPNYRKLGYWEKMHDQILKFAKEKEFKRLTLNTYKERFPNMYNFVITHGYKLVSEEFDELQKCTKSYFEKNIQ